MSRLFRLCTSCCLLLALLAPAAGAGEVAPADPNALARIAADARAATGAPAILLALQSPADGLQIVTSGWADAARKIPLDAQQPFPVGSITKLFTAVLVLQLASEGRLSLDDPLARYQPQFPNAANITLRQLLNHTSGIWDYTELKLPPMLIPLLAGKSFSPREIVDFVATHEPYFAPGAGFHYSNTNYILLGLVLEQAADERYGALLHGRILDPLELEHTLLAGYDALPASDLRGYALIGGTPCDRTSWENPSLAWSAGALVSNAEDLLRFITALFAGELLPPAAMAELQAGVPMNHAGEYGLGLMQFELPGGRACGHSGETLGFSSDLYYQPQSGAALVLLTNLSFCPTRDTLAAVLEYLHEPGAAAQLPAEAPRG